MGNLRLLYVILAIAFSASLLETVFANRFSALSFSRHLPYYKKICPFLIVQRIMERHCNVIFPVSKLPIQDIAPQFIRIIIFPSIIEYRSCHASYILLAACLVLTVSIANGRQGWLVYCVGGVTDGNPVDTIRVVSIKGDYCSFSDYLPSGPLPPPRTDHAVTKVGDRLLMTGGISNGKPLGDLWELDITQNPLRPKWVEHQASHLPPRSKHFAYQKHGCLFVCGGVDVNNKRLNDIWKWEPSKGWSKAGFVVQPELVLGAFSGGLVLMSQTFKPVRPGTVADSYQSKVAYLLEN